MRDLYASQALQAELTDEPVKVSNAGMRHSVRPRRVVSAQAARSIPVQPEPVQIDEVVLDEAVQLVAPFKGGYLASPALPRWHELRKVETGTRRANDTALPVVDGARDSASVRAFDLLRTRLRQTTQEHGWTNIAVTAPTSGCGNTFIAVNLALSLSRISGSRTMLMDFNLRKPGIAKAFDIAPNGSMNDFLAGHTEIGDHMVRVSDTLALGLNDAADTNASEILQAADTALTLERMRAALQPELVIYDMPAMLTHDDVSAFLPQLDGVLLVSDGTRTMGHQLMECERMLEGQVPLLGVVLNRARANSIQRYS